jgi:hypothetical protein
MPVGVNWRVSSKTLADGSQQVTLTRTEYGLTQRTSRTVSYRVPAGEQVPTSSSQFERAWKRATESPAERARREERAARAQANQDLREAALMAAPPRTRRAYKTGCSVMLLGILAAVGVLITGIVALATNPCFEQGTPGEGCSVNTADPPGSSDAWHLIIGAVLALCLLGLAGSLTLQSLTDRGKRQDRQDEQEAARRNLQERQKAQEALSQYQAEFQSQGYDAPAAEALARKRLRDERPAQRTWHPADIANERRETERLQQATTAAQERERERAERQRKVDAGEIAQCPRCHEYAPASQGVILAHRVKSHGKPCQGEGTILTSL